MRLQQELQTKCVLLIAPDSPASRPISRPRRDPGQPRGEPLRLEDINDFIFSSPVGAGGRIYITARDGNTVALRHDLENAMLALNHLEDSFSATAAAIDRELYLRGEHFI